MEALPSLRIIPRFCAYANRNSVVKVIALYKEGVVKVSRSVVIDTFADPIIIGGVCGSSKCKEVNLQLPQSNACAIGALVDTDGNPVVGGVVVASINELNPYRAVSDSQGEFKIDLPAVEDEVAILVTNADNTAFTGLKVDTPAAGEACLNLGVLTVMPDPINFHTCDPEAIQYYAEELCDSLAVLANPGCELDWGAVAYDLCVDLGFSSTKCKGLKGALATYISKMLQSMYKVCANGETFTPPDAAGLQVIIDKIEEGAGEANLCAGLVSCLASSSISYLSCSELQEVLSGEMTGGSEFSTDFTSCINEKVFK